MATVTNRAKSPRGFASVAGRHVTVAPGQTVEIDLPAEHPVHDAWVAAGHVDIVHPDIPDDAETETGGEPETDAAAPTEETEHVGKRRRAVHQR